MGSRTRQSLISGGTSRARIALLCGVLLFNSLALVTGALANDAPIVIGRENAKRTTIAIGRPFLIKLPVQFGTGYSWTVKKLPKTVVVISKTVETPRSLQPGGQEYQVFEVKAEAAGNEHVIFSLVQPFAPNQKATRTVDLNLIASE
jgi:hypothetical protein